MVARFGLGGRYVADGFEETAVVVPGDPLESGVLHCLEAPPWSSPMDHLGLEQADDRLRQSIVVGVTDAAHGGLDPGLGQPLRVAQRKILRPADALLFVKQRCV